MLCTAVTATATAVDPPQQTNTFLVRLDVLDVFLSKFLSVRDLCNPDDRAVKNSALAALFALRDMMTTSALISLNDICMVS